jgi:hypothetical protein
MDPNGGAVDHLDVAVVRDGDGVHQPVPHAGSPAVIDARHASRLVGQQRLNNAPLEVGQIVSAHADAESGFHRMGKIASL